MVPFPRNDSGTKSYMAEFKLKRVVKRVLLEVALHLVLPKTFKVGKTKRCNVAFSY